MKDFMRVRGRYEAISENERTGETRYYRNNTLTQLLFTGMFKFFNYDIDTPGANSLNFTHIAIGDGTTPSAKTDTILVNEIFRKDVASKIYTSSIFTTKAVIASSEGNPTGGFVKEVACFAAASATPGSGTMVSRANVNIEKNANIKLTISWILEIV